MSADVTYHDPMLPVQAQGMSIEAPREADRFVLGAKPHANALHSDSRLWLGRRRRCPDV